jgi:hypothetical protein
MIPPRLRHKRIWDSKDFAEFLGDDVSHWQARERLKTYDQAMSGMLLIRSKGTNRRYTFHPALLAKAFPALFVEIDGLSVRVDELEDKVGELYDRQNQTNKTVENANREIAKMRRRKAA